MKKQHVNYRTIRCGMSINKQYPWLRVTPDVLSWCKCCGYRCGEVKYPYCLDGIDFQSYVKKSSSCLEMQDGNMKLERDHQYYFQIHASSNYSQQIFCFVTSSFVDSVSKLLSLLMKEFIQTWSTGMLLSHSCQHSGGTACCQKF